MNPSLQLTTLATLPVHIRDRANAALHGSFQDFLAVDRFVHSPGTSLTHRRALLPFFYWALNPMGLNPLRRQLRAIAESSDFTGIKENSRRILKSLWAILRIVSEPRDQVVDPRVLRHLWPRIWPWAHFFYEFREQLPLIPIALEQIYLIYLQLCQMLTIRAIEGQDDETMDLIATTTGLRTVVGAAWVHFIETKNTIGLALVSYALQLGTDTDTIQNTDYHKELAAGAGGDWTNLAECITAHLRLSFPRHDSPATAKALDQISGIVPLLTYGLDFAPSECFEALRRQGISGTLTTLVRALSNASALPQNLPFSPETMLGPLTLHFMNPHDGGFVQALRHGFLHALFTCGRKDYLFGDELEIFFENIPLCAIHYSVLRQLRISRTEIQDLDPVVHLGSKANVLKSWQDFMQILQQRESVVHHFESGFLTALRACNNSKCTHIADKHQFEFKRCAGCVSAIYCSESCQRADWREGHRAACGQLRQRKQDEYEKFTPKDRAFFRALLNHEYAVHREQIALKNLRFVHTHPTATPLVIFDYSQGQCRISVKAESEMGVVFEDLYKPEINQARRSGGRVQLHLIQMTEGWVSMRTLEDVKRAYHMVPFYSASPALYEGLRSIANGMPLCTKGEKADLRPYRARVAQLVLMAGVQTH